MQNMPIILLLHSFKPKIKMLIAHLVGNNILTVHWNNLHFCWKSWGPSYHLSPLMSSCWSNSQYLHQNQTLGENLPYLQLVHVPVLQLFSWFREICFLTLSSERNKTSFVESPHIYFIILFCTLLSFGWW